MNRLFPVAVLVLAAVIALNPWLAKTGTIVVLSPGPVSSRNKQLDPLYSKIAAEKDQIDSAIGKELFVREWLPGDRRSHNGDGLGPLYNDRSCVACHHLGGVGGAGTRGKNVTVISAFLQGESPKFGFFGGMVILKSPRQPFRLQLAQIHPALLTQNSFLLHRYGADQEFDDWKYEFRNGEKPPGQEPDIDEFGVGFEFQRRVGPSIVHFVASHRRAPALFGAGIINQIPVRALEQVAASQALIKAVMPETPSGNMTISGRVARLKDGRVGRFGWKGQTPTLREFTLQACALELGLDVPGFPQSTPPWDPSYRAPGLDLSNEQCDALVDFVASLPPPVRKPPETKQHAAEVSAGRQLFDGIGCAVCHRPRLGKVDGIYSDLLLHDMGEELSDNGMYGASILAGDGFGNHLDLPVLGESDEDGREKRPKFEASPTEWRTPPLWGLRFSTSYMHDGRADTIEAAVALHHGEGLESAENYRRLSMSERQQLELFLQSLGVPALEPE